MLRKNHKGGGAGGVGGGGLSPCISRVHFSFEFVFSLCSCLGS